MERDPQIRVPYKGRRILNQIFSSVLYTNGYNTLEEDKKFEHSANEMEVPMIGTNPKHFDEVRIEIDLYLFIGFIFFSSSRIWFPSILMAHRLCLIRFVNRL
jgi:hypothetical protein